MPDHPIDEYERRNRRRISAGDVIFAVLLCIAVVGATAIVLSVAFHVVERVAVETAQAKRIGRY